MVQVFTVNNSYTKDDVWTFAQLFEMISLQQIAELQKENFSLKLRIYFLEESARKHSDGTSDDIFRLVCSISIVSWYCSLPNQVISNWQFQTYHRQSIMFLLYFSFFKTVFHELKIYSLKICSFLFFLRILNWKLKPKVWRKNFKISRNYYGKPREYYKDLMYLKNNCSAGWSIHRDHRLTSDPNITQQARDFSFRRTQRHYI